MASFPDICYFYSDYLSFLSGTPDQCPHHTWPISHNYRKPTLCSNVETEGGQEIRKSHGQYNLIQNCFRGVSWSQVFDLMHCFSRSPFSGYTEYGELINKKLVGIRASNKNQGEKASFYLLFFPIHLISHFVLMKMSNHGKTKSLLFL